MPEESKKNIQKGKNDPKEQRRRRGRQNPAPIEKKVEKAPEPLKEPEKPAYEPPGPEFYKGLKRETDEILKITEEANSKYKKKEIQSNWAKYELPIETYEEIDEQENLGADYEALIQAPLSVGGHFQFKHEKSWDITTGPSIYDKYFDINMENLNLALSTIPFFERNNIDMTIFSESEIQCMNHRATKFQQKYYNDKNFTTPEIDAQEKILNSLKSENTDAIEEAVKGKENNTILDKDIDSEKLKQFKDIDLGQCEQEKHESSIPILDSNPDIENDTKKNYEPVINDNLKEISKAEDKEVIAVEYKTILDMGKTIKTEVVDNDFDVIKKEILDKIKTIEPEIPQNPQEKAITLEKQSEKAISPKLEPSKVDTQMTKELAKNPIIESPEDLERWLDDFLDG